MAGMKALQFLMNRMQGLLQSPVHGHMSPHLLCGLVGGLLLVHGRDEGGQHALLARGLGQLGGAGGAAADDAVEAVVLRLEVLGALQSIVSFDRE